LVKCVHQSAFCLNVIYCTLLVRPKAIDCGADLSFTADVLFIYFLIFYFNARSPKCIDRAAWNFVCWLLLGRIL